MRGLGRIGAALAGLALASPAFSLSMAGPPDLLSPTDSGTAATAPTAVKGVSRVALGAKAAPARPKGKAKAERLCSVCQYEKTRAETGLNIPPPESLPPGTPVAGSECTKCGAATAVVMSGPMTPARAMPAGDRTASAPGRASAGGPGDARSASGYAVVNEPTPISATQPRMASAGGMGAGPMGAPMGMSRPGARDSAVMPTSAASDPVSPKAHKRPHILGHLFGVSELRNDMADALGRRGRDGHAAIPYGPSTQPVTDLPASAVYGR